MCGPLISLRSGVRAEMSNCEQRKRRAETELFGAPSRLRHCSRFLKLLDLLDEKAHNAMPSFAEAHSSKLVPCRDAVDRGTGTAPPRGQLLGGDIWRVGTRMGFLRVYQVKYQQGTADSCKPAGSRKLRPRAPLGYESLNPSRHKYLENL